MLVLCLEGFSQLVQLMASHYPDKMPSFLSHLHSVSDEAAGDQENTQRFIKHLQVCSADQVY